MCEPIEAIRHLGLGDWAENLARSQSVEGFARLSRGG